MRINQKIFIVKTVAGDVISIRNSMQFTRGDVSRVEATGVKCVVIEATVDAIHTREE